MTAPYRRHAAAGSLQRGFTLLEILVAMALLSTIMLALGASMRTLGQSQERIDARLGATDDLRSADSLLRATLERVSVRPTQAVRPAGSSTYLIEPTNQSLAWVGIMPVRYGAGGRHFFRLGIETQRGSSALVLRFLPWVDTGAFPDWTQAEARVLAQHVTAFAISYLDDRLPEPLWEPAWTVVDRLPGRVRISIQTDTETWPPVIAALRPLRLPQSASGRFSIGGSK